MSQLLDAIAGVPNAREPVPGLATGGQPTAEHLAALKAAGCDLVLDIRDPMEPRSFDEAAAVRAAGMEYVNIPVSAVSQSDATLDRVRDTVAGLAGRRKAFFHCRSGNRVGATLIPYLMLNQGLGEEEAVTQAMQMGTRSVELIEWALEYVNRRRDAETPSGG